MRRMLQAGNALATGEALPRFSAAAALSRRAAVAGALACAGAALLGAAGCVDQHPRRAGSASGGDALRLVATSPATAQILDKLELPLVGVSSTSRGLPERYANVKQVGTAMAPELEILSNLRPDFVISPNSLMSDLQPKYAAASLPCIFIDLKSVDGLFDSVSYLGRKFDREAQASQLVAEHKAYMAEYRAQAGFSAQNAPSVLVLMGVPGSYVVATPRSYVGSLVALAGGRNVYEDAEQDFINVNTEDMLARDPDIILRTAHALPQQVMAMFAEEFETNDIWKHFRAVQDGRVHDLDSAKFGMSAEFNYPQALEDLQPLLAGDAGVWAAEDTKKEGA